MFWLPDILAHFLPLSELSVYISFVVETSSLRRLSDAISGLQKMKYFSQIHNDANFAIQNFPNNRIINVIVLEIPDLFTSFSGVSLLNVIK